MTGRLRDRPAALLTRHFFHSLFDFGVFTPEGADSFVRLLIGVFAAILAFGFVLVRMYAIKYGRFAAFPTAEPYTRALMADTTLVIALPMWIVALVTVLVSHSLFPDETDFRVLMPMPLARPVVFGAKLASLGLFAGLFTIASHAAITPLALLISFSRWAVDAVPLRLLSFWAASLAASTFAVLGVVAANGLLIALTPRSRIHALTAAMRSTMLGGLMLALPLVIALPTQGDRLAARSTLMFLAPPAWFLGVQQVLLGHGDVYCVRLAQLAAIGLLSAAAISAASYYELYRRFDRVMLRSLGTSTRPWLRGPASRNPARAAVHDFTTATLRRSTLHQGVVVGLSACGVALAVNSLIRNGILLWLRGVDVPRWEIVGAVTWTPIALVLILGIAARAALTLPVEPKANWVFRMTEHDAIRADQLSAAERVIIRFSVLLPIALTLPLQWMAAGPRALVSSAMTGAFGMLWAEALLRGWRRIPFTCAYMPGKHLVVHTVVVGLGTFAIVTTVCGGMETAAIRSSSAAPGLVIAGILLAAAALIRRRRRTMWSVTPLAFDDQLPSDVQPFRLSEW